ncbi:hypothetical protein CAOG_009491 [Capsaspora owczarzaki ATCC 30864]|uniref:Uncharacterized protein n=1 Tax=Capsaspora owczarzaki (strain ATCC 30864) TaxID=595528 RepID=A0A0D2VL45_CAPO3|nr:hypothetical protein CAOG_009491 [Capsaspora owczarzaki ATCC 30864]
MLVGKPHKVWWYRQGAAALMGGGGSRGTSLWGAGAGTGRRCGSTTEQLKAERLPQQRGGILLASHAQKTMHFDRNHVRHRVTSGVAVRDGSQSAVKVVVLDERVADQRSAFARREPGEGVWQIAGLDADQRRAPANCLLGSQLSEVG